MRAQLAAAAKALRLVGAIGFAVLGWTDLAGAQDYPTRPVRMIVGFPPGGAADFAARLISKALSERLGQPFVVENRPGAGNNIGTEAAANAAPDGYTLLLVNTANAINASLYAKTSFNFIQDIVPVPGIVRAPLVLVVNPAVPARTMGEFLAYAHDKSGRINMASAGVGSSPHLAGELLKMMAGIDMLHVPYRGGAPAVTDLLAGQVQAMFATASSCIEQVRASKLRALAVTTAMRSPALPATPALAELIPGYAVVDWYGIGAPRKTPRPVIAKLGAAINAVLDDEEIRKRLADFGGVPFSIAQSELEGFVADETKKWAEVVRFSGAKVD